MNNIHVTIAGLTAVILFIFGLENFSKEIEKISGEKFRKFLSKSTRIPVLGVLIGAVVTAIIQSSSATSVIAIGLVNAGVLSFKNSVGVIFGANIGTTITAQLVAYKLTSFAPILIILGFLLSLKRSRYSLFAKSIFYFGFVFFSLNLISTSLSPLQNDPILIKYLSTVHNPLITILIGGLFTAMVQSSSVTTGLAVILTQQGLLSLENAVPILMGANIGTTVTALIAMINFDIAAKKTAFAHLLFNVGGVIIFTPAFLIWGKHLNTLSSSPAVTLAFVHLVFNVMTSFIFVIFISPFTKFIDRVLGEGKMDFERFNLPKKQDYDNFNSNYQLLEKTLGNLLAFLQENYNLVTLGIETNYKSVFEACQKRIEYIDFFRGELVSFFSQLIGINKDQEQSKFLLSIIHKFEYLIQIHDSIKDLLHIKNTIDNNYIELKSDILLFIRELSSKTLSLFDIIHHSLTDKKVTKSSINKEAKELQSVLDELNQGLLSLMALPNRKDAAAIIHLVTYSQRLKDKLINFEKVLEQ